MTYKELIGFFKERLVELLDNATLDSYRVRHHNTLSILKEKEISFTFSSNIIFLSGKLIDLNEETYLKALWDKIELFIFNDKELSKEDFIPQVDELNQMTMNLVRQLLNTGYSKSSLFKAVTNFIELPDSIEEFRKFRRNHSGGNHKIYKVVFSLRIPNKLNINSAQLTRQLPEEICNATDKKNTTHQKFIKSTINHYFFHTDIPAYDRQSALREGKRQLLEELDTLYLCRDRMEAHIDDRALTIYKKANGENVTYSHNIPLVLEGAFSHTEKNR